MQGQTHMRSWNLLTSRPQAAGHTHKLPYCWYSPALNDMTVEEASVAPTPECQTHLHHSAGQHWCLQCCKLGSMPASCTGNR